MNELMFKEVSKEYEQTKDQFYKSLASNNFTSLPDIPPGKILIENTLKVVNLLKETPFISASGVAKKASLTKEEILLAYKYIQCSDLLQHELKKSNNRDYFNVVNHNFNNKFYTVVFFVGLTCPSRCIFCPNVKVDAAGNRSLVRYHKNLELLKEECIERIFQDLNTMKKEGSGVLVKVSGGLEPLTDLKTLNFICDLAARHDIHVKLFTNGLLLNTIESQEASLKTSDVRISLSTADELEYEKICFNNNRKNRKPIGLIKVKNNIATLVKMRDRKKLSCHIGLNTIIMPSNYKELGDILKMAMDLGIDYIDFKPDYFADDYLAYESKIKEEIAKVKAIYLSQNSRMYINFVNSISKDNFYWHYRTGVCDAIKQSRHKIFITPFGTCSPIHYGAFPHSENYFDSELQKYSIGNLNRGTSLLEMLAAPISYPKVPYDKLNPFELMLMLEIKREEEDTTWGIPIEYSPYHTRFRMQTA